MPCDDMCDDMCDDIPSPRLPSHPPCRSHLQHFPQIQGNGDRSSHQEVDAPWQQDYKKVKKMKEMKTGIEIGIHYHHAFPCVVLPSFGAIFQPERRENLDKRMSTFHLQFSFLHFLSFPTLIQHFPIYFARMIGARAYELVKDLQHDLETQPLPPFRV
jgi:hypothetical protein